MKRITALRALSIDHHHTLTLARKAKIAASDDQNAYQQLKIWGELEKHAQDILKDHFRIEEIHIATALAALNDPRIEPLIQRLYQEHARLLDLLSPDSPRTAMQLKQTGELLAQHIRFEERELFEIAQKELDPQTLDVIARICDRKSNRP